MKEERLKKEKMLWEEWFFGEHSKHQMIEWIKIIKKFRYVRAIGGHANDCDELLLGIVFNNTSEMLLTLEKWGVILKKHHEKPPQPLIGIRYSGKEYMSFPSIIKGTFWVEEPGHCTIFGQNVFISCGEKGMYITANLKQKVTDSDIKKAQIIEQHLSHFDLEYRDPPRDNKYCLCPKYHLEIFNNE